MFVENFVVDLWCVGVEVFKVVNLYSLVKQNPINSAYENHFDHHRIPLDNINLVKEKKTFKVGEVDVIKVIADINIQNVAIKEDLKILN